jgi:outer membrane protein TolC
MRVALAIAAALAVTTSAAAQTGTPTIDRPVPARLTLQEALSRAIETSHILAELRAREGAATAVLDQRKASDMPALSAQAGYRRTNHVEEFTVPQPNPPRLEVIYPDVPDNWRTRLDLAWPSTPAVALVHSSTRRTRNGWPAARTSRARAPISFWRRRARSGRS